MTSLNHSAAKGNIFMERQSSNNGGHYPGVYSSRPRIPNAHLFQSGTRHMLLSVTRGQIYELDDILAHTVDRTMDFGDGDRVGQFLTAAGIFDSPVDERPPGSVPVRALSLAVAQKCNLGCTYCYAQQGSFGGATSSMSIDVAKGAIDRLFEQAPQGQKISLAFLGGEPLANRSVLKAATEYAAYKASAATTVVSFAITTNATLVTEEDVKFFDRYGFAVTVSIDGSAETHNILRPFKSGGGSYDRVVDRLKLLLQRSPRRFQVTARVTVTPRNLRLPETLNELVELGFDGVLFSPVLRSPTGVDQMSEGDFDVLLRQLIECGRTFERRVKDIEIFPFLNVVNTLQRIHQRNLDAYPCGAGGGYLGVSSKGGIYACHRFVEEEVGAMGNVTDGIDTTKQRLWLLSRNVHIQEPCRTCWARYLCSGGCHHEAIHRGRPACDYIRGWLHYCLGLYVTLLKDNPPVIDRSLNFHRPNNI